MEFGIQFFPDGTKATEIIEMYQEHSVGFEHAMLQVHFHNPAFDEAERPMRMFADEVMPHCGQGVR